MSWSRSMVGICASFTLDNGGPVIPFFGNFGENTAHHSGRCHETVAFALDDSHFTASHCFAQPLDVFHGHTAIFATVMDNHGPSDINITEANGLAAFQTGQQVNGWVGIRGGEVPDLVRKAGVVV